MVHRHTEPSPAGVLGLLAVLKEFGPRGASNGVVVSAAVLPPRGQR